MTKFLLPLFLFLFFYNISPAQTPDSGANKDTVPPDTASIQPQPIIPKDTTPKDTVNKVAIRKPRIRKDSTFKKDSAAIIGAIKKDSLIVPQEIPYTRTKAFSFRDVLLAHPYYNFLGHPISAPEQIHQAKSYDSIFYLLVGILFYFALVRVFFRKYLANLFNLFFQVSMRQQQLREQVLQSPLPSLLLNILFVITGALYACFLTRYYKVAETVDFWMLLVNCAGLLSVIYLVKFLFLKIIGWIFNIQRAADAYIFVIFLANKILAIFLLPVLVILSFSGYLVRDITITVSLAMVFIFFAYRFFAAYGLIRKEIKLNGFHFFLYLCAFEITPLLLIYKVLLSYLEKAY